MPEQPFLSIVIPTKNRPEYVGDAIFSVLNQSFTDLECIVSDNFNDERTLQAIQPFLSDKRMRYVRTDSELNMMEHWEWASRNARGKYVMVLADRKVLYSNALEVVHKVILEYSDANVFTVGVKMYNNELQRLGWAPLNRSTGKLSTKLLMSNFMHKDYFNAYTTLDRYFPKTLNGLYKREYAEQVRNTYGSYFNLPGVLTPDYSSFFVNCALNKYSVHIGHYVILTQAELISNGRNFGNGNYHEHMNSIRAEDPFSMVPINMPFIYNLLLSDFLHIKNKINGHLSSLEIDWENYLYNCLREYYLYKENSPFMDEAGKKMFLIAWQRGVNHLIEEGLITPERVITLRKKVRSSLISKLPKKTMLNLPVHLRDFVINNFGGVGIVNKVFPHRFSNALEAAGYAVKPQVSR